MLILFVTGNGLATYIHSLLRLTYLTVGTLVCMCVVVMAIDQQCTAIKMHGDRVQGKTRLLCTNPIATTYNNVRTQI